MRVLMISKALVAGTSQRKLEELAKCPGVELTLVTPPYWQSDDGGKQMLERLYTGGYRMIVTPMRLNGNFHLHYYPRLAAIMGEAQPDVVHIDEEPYNFATFQAMRLAKSSTPARSFSPGRISIATTRRRSGRWNCTIIATPGRPSRAIARRRTF